MLEGELGRVEQVAPGHDQVLGDGLGVARFERPQLGSGGLVELAARDVVVDLGRTVTVGRDVVPVITPATVALGAVREAGAVVTARGVAPTAVVLTVVTTTRSTVASAPVALTAVALTPVTTRGVASTAAVLTVVTTAAVALALTTRTPLTLPLITTLALTPVTTRSVATAAIVLTVVTTVVTTARATIASAPVALAPVTTRSVAPTAVVLTVVTTAAVALALTTRTPLTLPLITTVSTRGVAPTAIILPVVPGPAGGTARAVAAPVAVARVAGRAASSVVGPPPGRRSGTVTLASRSSAGPTVAGSSVPTLVPGPVLE
ncbi:hypothetical protein RCG67_11320 [Kocuria sp. CPCC 205292]|uniref:hypothetical protein n=1 Tax=Kocuria cellulosilytica TaxID=3071451 RepID=UPI0034D42804